MHGSFRRRKTVTVHHGDNIPKDTGVISENNQLLNTKLTELKIRYFFLSINDINHKGTEN